MKTITLHDDAKITVDGVEYVPQGTNAKKPERVLWTPKDDETYWDITADGHISEESWENCFYESEAISAGNVFPTNEHAEAAKRHREAQSVIDRYCYAKGIDTRWKQGVMQCCVNLGSGELVVSHYMDSCDGSPFWVDTKEIAEQIIAECPDEIRTVLLRGWV